MLSMRGFHEMLPANSTEQIKILSEDEFKELEKQFPTPQVTRRFSRERILDAFGEAFELIGGIPRLALWAHDNPTKFYGHMARLGTTNSAVSIHSGGPIIIKPSLPPSALDE